MSVVVSTAARMSVVVSTAARMSVVVSVARARRSLPAAYGVLAGGLGEQNPRLIGFTCTTNPAMAPHRKCFE